MTLSSANGKGLRMIVCMKVVPRPEEVRVHPETKTLDRANARSLINPPDLNALEMALGLRDLTGGSVSILSMGPPFAEPYLRLAMAMGADRVYLLSDRAFGGADTLATTYTLAKGIERTGSWDLAFCGEKSSDGATAQVPPGLAEWLDAAQVTCAMDILPDRKPGVMKVRRDVKGGWEDLLVRLPAVVSAKSDANEPRFFDSDRWEWAFGQAPVTVWGAKDLDVEPERIGFSGSPTTVAGVRQVAARERKKKFLSGSPEEIARELSRLIRPKV